MKNIKFLSLMGFLLLLVVSSPMIQAQELPAGLDTVGVNNGDTFNFLVSKNNLDLSSLGIDASVLAELGIDFSEFGIDTLNFEYHDAVNDITISPDEGDIVVVKVVDTASTKISLTLDGVSVELDTGFLLGSPVSYINWDLWETYLGDLSVDITTENSNITVGLDFTSSDVTYFVPEVSLDLPIPESLSELLTSFTVSLGLKYNKLSGIQERLEFNVTAVSTSQFIGTVKQSLIYELTTEEPSEPTSTSETDEGTGPDLSVPGFEFAIPLLTIGVVAILVANRRKD